MHPAAGASDLAHVTIRTGTRPAADGPRGARGRPFGTFVLTHAHRWPNGHHPPTLRRHAGTHRRLWGETVVRRTRGSGVRMTGRMLTGRGAPDGRDLPYRGPDRRTLIRASHGVSGVLVVTAGLLAVLVILVLLGPTTPGLDEAEARRLGTTLRGVSFTSAGVVAALCLLRWRLTGEAAALRLGVASGVYAALVLGPGVVYWALHVDAAQSLQVAARLAVVLLVALALAGPEVDARVRPWPTVGRTAAGIVLIAPLAAAVPGATRLLSTGAEQLPNGTSGTGWGIATLWAVLGTTALHRGHRDRRPLLAWFGLGLFVLAAAAIAPSWTIADGGTAPLGTSLLQVTAFLCIAAGAMNEIIRGFRTTDQRLLASVAAARAAEARLRGDHERQREHAHEAKNVLAAIEAASYALERHRDQLDASEQAELSACITNEVHRLQRLVEATSEPVEVGRFRPSEAIAPLLTSLATQVADIHVDVPDHLVAIGRAADTVQAIHNVLENARRYGAGTITVRATLAADTVVLRVSDEGPGVGEAEAATIFARGVRGRASAGTSGSGLGLTISRDLMNRQGGDLRLAVPDTGVGAAFEIVLPGFSTLVGQALSGQLADLREHAAHRRLRLVRSAAGKLPAQQEAGAERALGVSAS
jgi:signal transduction histidine kinase